MTCGQDTELEGAAPCDSRVEADICTGDGGENVVLREEQMLQGAVVRTGTDTRTTEAMMGWGLVAVAVGKHFQLAAVCVCFAAVCAAFAAVFFCFAGVFAAVCAVVAVPFAAFAATVFSVVLAHFLLLENCCSFFRFHFFRNLFLTRTCV